MNNNKVYYFRFIVAGHIESSYKKYNKALKKANKEGEKVYLCIYSEENIYSEVYDEEVITKKEQIKSAKQRLIKSYYKLVNN